MGCKRRGEVKGSFSDKLRLVSFKFYCSEYKPQKKLSLMEADFPQFSAFSSNGNTVRVESAAAGSISRCIESASPGTTVIIPAGEYCESLVIDKAIKVEGEGEVTLTASPGKDTVIVSGTGCVVRGIRIQPGNAQSASPVNFLKGSALFENCTISAQYMPPIVVHQEGSLYFAACSITSEEAAIMYIGNRVCAEFAGCVISSPRTVGIIATGDSKVRMLSNTNLTKCGDSGLILMDRATLHMDGCVVSENGGDAIELNTTSKANRIANSAIGNNTHAAVNCNGSGSLKIENCALSNGAMGLFATNDFQVEGVSCEICDFKESALVCATRKASISLLGGRLHGNCLLGIIADYNGTVTCDRVKIDEIPTTGASVTRGSVMTFMQCAFENIGAAAIEAHDDATLQLTGCQLATIKEIGIQIQNNVRGFIKETEIMACEVVGVHYVDNAAEFQFEQCKFTRCSGNAVHVKNTTVPFINCEFSENAAAGVEGRSSNTKSKFVGCTFAYNSSGVTLSEGCGGRFENCRFCNNQTTGAALTQALGLEFDTCEFSANGVGLVAGEGAELSCSKCQFVQNAAHGCQIGGADSDCRFTECVMTGQVQGSGVIVLDNGTANFTQCHIYQNYANNVTVQQEGRAVFVQCDLYQSTAGIGTFVTLNGSVQMTACAIHDEAQSGIVVSEGGNCTCEGSEIARCSGCGVYLLQGNQGTFTKNKVHDNGPTGFQVMEGSPSILENEIYSHEMYAINIAPSADPQVIGNVFKDNGVIDVNRE